MTPSPESVSQATVLSKAIAKKVLDWWRSTSDKEAIVRKAVMAYLPAALDSAREMGAQYEAQAITERLRLPSTHNCTDCGKIGGHAENEYCPSRDEAYG